MTVLAADPNVDPALTSKEVQELEKAHPDVEFVTVPGSSHHVHREFPLEIVRAVVERSGKM